MGGAGNGIGEPLLVSTSGGGEESIDVDEVPPSPAKPARFWGLAGELAREVAVEETRLWCLAAPAIFTAVAQYSLGAVTQVIAGHLTTLELDAVSVENMVVAGLALGIMLGMGSALETLCGQAYGANQKHMLGVYMQRSWVILVATALLMLPFYLLASPVLRLLGQDAEIAALAGVFSLYMIPQLFAYALNFPIQKFLQAQSKVLVMAAVTAAALVLHVLLSWLLVVRLRLGLAGAATSLNLCWWFIVCGQFAYVAMGYCPGCWDGFSWAAFRDLPAFAGLSIASGVMTCLETWYFTFLTVLGGTLNDAQIAVAALSICINLYGWEVMVFFGFNAAISVRVSNELGAGRPRAAKLAIAVVVLTSLLIGLVFAFVVLELRDVFGVPFTGSTNVVAAVAKLAVIFALTVILNSIQPVLTGVAVGAGWQSAVAIVNLCCYYVFGLPLGYFLANYMNLGVKGMWSGMLAGVGLQTMILIGITLWTDWEKEASAAEARIRKWGGSEIEPAGSNDGQRVT